MSTPIEFTWQTLLGLGIVSTVVTVIFTGFNDWLKRRHDLKKWRAEYYLSPKLEALRSLHRSMVTSHYRINKRVHAYPHTQEDYSLQVEEPKEVFFESLTTAEIYLDPETSKIMHDVLGSLRGITFSIWLNLPDDELPKGVNKQSYGNLSTPDFAEFTRAFDCAHERLRELLHPAKLLETIGEK